jgi:tRNA (Thr-GGU) A37 N-methylase
MRSEKSNGMQVHGYSVRQMNNAISLLPIGTIHNSRTVAIDDGWDELQSSIELDATRFTPESLAGLDGFSHIEVIFHFHAVADNAVVGGARHPRGRVDWPLVGIFAQRGKDRPNRIGATVCRIVRIDGLSILVQGLDAIDGTPVLDIKPCMRGFLPRGDIVEPAWATELMKNYW